jgi:arsenite-transporting ATPase
MRLVLYTGKGGVGKTTTAAATAVCAAERGRRTLVISSDAAHSLGDVLGTRLGPDPVALAPRLDAVEIDPRAVMDRHWGNIRDYLVSIFRYQGIEEVVAEELALLPGAEELATLLAVEDVAASGRYDFTVIDCAPTDATLRLVALPDVARGAWRMLLRIQRVLSRVVTPIAQGVVPIPLPGAAVFRDAETLLYRRLRDLRRRLSSADTSVRIVLTPERMVIDEARRLSSDLALFDVPRDAIVLNRLLPDAAANEDFFRDWSRLQEERRLEVEERFAPLRVLVAPLRDDEVIGLSRLSEHGHELFADAEPDAVLSEAPRVRFERAGEGYRLRLPLSGVRIEDLDVTKVDDELVVRAGGVRRAFPLPRRVASQALRSAELARDELVVCFGVAAPASGSS